MAIKWLLFKWCWFGLMNCVLLLCSRWNASHTENTRQMESDKASVSSFHALVCCTITCLICCLLKRTIFKLSRFQACLWQSVDVFPCRSRADVFSVVHCCRTLDVVDESLSDWPCRVFLHVIEHLKCCDPEDPDVVGFSLLRVVGAEVIWLRCFWFRRDDAAWQPWKLVLLQWPNFKTAF